MNKGTGHRFRHIKLFFLLLICILVYTQPAFVQAQISHRYTFGQSAVFNLLVSDAANYDNYTLYISASEMNITSQTVDSVNNVVSFERNLREQPLPPFSLITYWWEYTDSSETLITSAKHTFQYIDNRFAWQTYTDEDVHIYWVNGDKSIMMNAISIVKETIDEVQHALQKVASPAVDVYFYPSSKDLKSALQLAGFNWVAGAAYPELGVILLSVSEGKEAISQMQRTLPHELTHKMLFDIYGAEGYKNIPAWLEEGLASYFETTPDPAYTVILEESMVSGRLLHFDTLCYPFPDEQSVAFLAYAQSDSITRYVQQTYGWSSIRNLLQQHAVEGISCTSALEEELGIQITQFEREWRVWRQTQGNPNAQTPEWGILQLSPELRASITVFVKDASRWLILCALVIFPFVFFSLLSLLKKRSTR